MAACFFFFLFYKEEVGFLLLEPPDERCQPNPGLSRAERSTARRQTLLLPLFPGGRGGDRSLPLPGKESRKNVGDFPPLCLEPWPGEKGESAI